MRALATTLLVLTALCSAPAAAQLDGSYQLARVNGRALPAPSPTEPSVTLQRASFVFQADGRFSMLARSAEAGDDYEYSEGSDGSYRVRGDSLLLSTGNDETPVVFRWRMHADTLHLTDASSHDYTFVRGPAATAERLQGSYRLMRINGEPVPTASPAEETVTIQSLTVVLGADGRYTMQVRAHQAAQDAPIALDVSGSYRVEGTTLMLNPDEETQSQPAEFRWTFEGEALLLFDELDDEYTFARQ